MAALALAMSPADVPRPKEGHWIADAAEVMSAVEETSLERTLNDAHAAHAFELDVVTVPGTDGVDAAKFADELFQLWDVGGESDKGVLVVLVVELRRLEIRVGA